jgi:acetoacetate decarboxylase
VSEPPGNRVPPAPWRLRGRLTIVPALVRLASAQARVGSGGRVVPVAPGRTLGGALLASYETGSTLRYRELLVASALVRRGPMIGLWADHVWVDSDGSLAGGRQIWGIPKRRSQFSEPERGAVEVRTDDGALLKVCSGTPRALIPQPLFAPLFGTLGSEARWCLGRGIGLLGIARVRLHIPDRGVLAELELEWPSFALTGHALISVPAPRGAGRACKSPAASARKLTRRRGSARRIAS